MVGNHLVKHGDGAKDVAFEVEDLDYIVKVSNVNAVIISSLLKFDEKTQLFILKLFYVSKLIFYHCL